MNETQKEYIKILIETLVKGEDGFELTENEKDALNQFLIGEMNLDEVKKTIIHEED